MESELKWRQIVREQEAGFQLPPCFQDLDGRQLVISCQALDQDKFGGGLPRYRLKIPYSKR
jgi:hypothetical protein